VADSVGTAAADSFGKEAAALVRTAEVVSSSSSVVWQVT